MKTRKISIIVPRHMATVEVIVHATDAELDAAYKACPASGEEGPVLGFCEHLQAGSSRIHLGPSWTLSDLAHECVHAAQCVAGYVENLDDEFIAYLTGWLVERVAVRLMGRAGK